MSDWRDPVRRFLGGFLMAAGALIAGLCGTCSAAYVVVGVTEALRYPDGAGMAVSLGAVALVGGVPTLVGVLLFRAGWRHFRGPKPIRRAQFAMFSDEPEDRA